MLSFFKKNDPFPLTKSVLKAYNATRQAGQVAYVCHAPFKAMHFANNGRVLACCFNRQAVLGEYPGQSLREIWQGQEAQKLRRCIKHNDLSYGCFVCHNQLHNGAYETVQARMFDHLPGNKAGYPTQLSFDLDNTCNLACIMCNADNSSVIRQMSPLYGPYVSPYDNKFVDALEPFIPHLHQANFAGGEPFLIKLYYDIWERIISINPAVRLNVTTNGTILNDKVKNLLNKGFFEISISLDSICKETYEYIRQNAAFETVMENLLYFRDYCRQKDTFFGVWACPVRANMYELPDMFRHFGNQDIELFLHTVWVPPSVSLWNLPASELRALINAYREAILPGHTEIQKKNKQRFADYVLFVESCLALADKREAEVPDNATPEVHIQNLIVQQHKSKGLSKKQLHSKNGDFETKLTFCKTHLPPEIYKTAINLLITYPDDFMYQIFEAGSKEMICDFFKYLVRKP